MRWRRYCLHSHAVGGCHIPGANRLGTLLPACVLRGPRSSLHKTGAKKIHSDSLLGTRLYCLHSAVFIHVRPARAREPIGAGTRTSKRSFKAPAMYLRGSAIHPQCCGTRDQLCISLSSPPLAMKPRRQVVAVTGGYETSSPSGSSDRGV